MILGKAVTESDEMLAFFGSLLARTFTLFMTVAGGIDWRDAALPLQSLDNKVAFCSYLLYVAFMVVCVMNVLTGTFCNAAIEAAALDRESVIDCLMEDLERMLFCLRKFSVRRTIQAMVCSAARNLRVILVI